MTSYFSTPERIQSLHAEQARWLGTPFRQYHAEPGVGADCVGLLRGGLANLGLIAPLAATDLPLYPMDWSAHNPHSLLEEWLQTRGHLGLRLTEVTDPSALQAGDVLLFCPGRCVYHMAWAESAQRFLHCLAGKGVERVSPLHRQWPRYRGYFRKAWRIMEVAP